MLPRIIAICGRRRSGKDTIANYICSKYPQYSNTKISCQLKGVIKMMFGFTDDQLENDAKDIVDNRWGITPRHAMQYIGTEVMQFGIQNLLPNTGRKFWIKSYVENVLSNPSMSHVVVSDMRFVHEYEELMKHNAFVIRVERNESKPCKEDEHISELEYLQIPADLILENNGTIEDLLIKIDDTLTSK